MSFQKVVNATKNQTLGTNPWPRCCDAQRRNYTGARYASYVFCSRPKRKGQRTCWQHAKLEE